MALLTCPECGGKVSDRAECCPHCGYPVSYILNAKEAHVSNKEVVDSHDFVIVGTVLLRYRGMDSIVRIPDGITEIAESAFAYNGSITTLLASNGLSTICEYAFSHCVNLKYLDLPDSVERIGDYAFEHCINLQCINSPMDDGSEPDIISAYELGKNCIVIPERVSKIGNHAFEGCSSIQRVCMQECVHNIGINSFANCINLREIYAFGYDPLYICAFAFYNCQNLISARLDAAEILYEEFCFAKCRKLYRVSLRDCPAIHVQTYAFYGCSNLDYVFQDLISRNLCKKIQNSFPNNTVVVEGWILRKGFGGWIIDRQTKQIKGKLVIPDTVGDKKIIGIGGDAFGWMQYDLEEVYISEGIEFIEDAVEVISEKTGQIEFSCGAFENCEKLHKVVFPKTLLYIGSSAFSGTNLQELQFPPELRKIGACAFSTGSSSLKKIKFPNSLREIGEYAFSGCVKYLNYSGNVAKGENIGVEIDNFPSSLQFFGQNAYDLCDNYISWLKKGVEEGNATAKYHYSTLVKDLNVARKLLEESAEQGYRVAQYELGVAIEKTGDTETAMIWFEKAAAQGYTAAQIQCGEIYTSSKSPSIRSKGRMWYRKAADKLPCDDKLQFRCAQLFCDKYLNCDTLQAFYYLSRSAKSGNTKAQNILKTLKL